MAMIIFNTIGVGPVRLHRPIHIPEGDWVNPGIGGSEFHSLQLAKLFAESGHRVRIFVEGNRPTWDPKLEKNIVALSEFDPTNLNLLVTPVGSVEGVIERISDTPFPVALVSHHPHDRRLGAVRKRLGRNCTTVNVGRYQYFSNLRYSGSSSVWLPAFTPKGGEVPEVPIGRIQSGKPQALLAGHVSSLHPTKGFHVLLAGFLKAGRTDSGMLLDVYGGSGLYHHASENQVGAFDSTPYSRKISRILKGENASTRVRFHGIVDGDLLSIIKKWDIALLNPVGIAEADPIVVQDCLRATVPVVAGSLFGFYDYMRYFPELQAHSSGQVSQRLKEISAGQLDMRVLKIRARELYELYLERRTEAERLWIQMAATPNASAVGLDPGAREQELLVRIFIGRLIYIALDVANWISKRFS